MLGWVTPTRVKGTLIDQTVAPAETTPEVYQLLDGGPNTGEYFLIENRQQTLFDSGLTGSGLLIWHIDHKRPNNDNQDYPGCVGCTGYYRVGLEQADGSYELERNLNRGDAADPFPQICDTGTCNNSFGESTSPNSDLNGGLPSGVSVTEITSSSGVVTATLRTNEAVTDLEVIKTHSGKLTAGEIGTFLLTIRNPGTVTSNGRITVLDDLPQGISYVAATGEHWLCGVSGPTVSCTRDLPLAPGAESTVLLTVMVSETLSGVLSNEAHVLLNGDSNLGNNSDTDTAAVNHTPRENAGVDQTVKEGTTVTLDGSSSSDVDGDPLIFAWVQTAGPVVTLSDPAAARPTFKAPRMTGAPQIILEFEMTVSDGAVTSESDRVIVTVTPESRKSSRGRPRPGARAGSATRTNG